MAHTDAPSDKVFEEIRKASIEIWQTYDDTYGYASEKIDRVNSLTNFKDNWGTMVGMFDSNNQVKLLLALADKPDAIAKIKEWL